MSYLAKIHWDYARLVKYLGGIVRLVKILEQIFVFLFIFRQVEYLSIFHVL